MTNSPLVSIIIPCYRDAKTLSFAINSLYRQTYQNIEIIVVNDASPETDVIERVLESYPSITYVKNKVNLGLAASRNVGLRKARGEFVAFLDADDEYHSRKIELQMSCVGENVAVACDTENFSGQSLIRLNFEGLSGGHVEVVNGLWKISLFNYLTGASILISRDLLLSVDGYDESLRSCEDYDLWLRILKQGIKVSYIKLPLYLYRFNPDGLSKNINAISFWELEVVKKNISTIEKSWFNNFFTILIWITWFFRHLIRAEESKNSQLKNVTLSNSKNFSSSLFAYYVVSCINFLRLAWHYVKVCHFIDWIFSKISNRDNADQSKIVNFVHPRFIKTSFISNKIIWVSFFIYSLTTALLFQMLLPILLPSLHAGSGLLSHDSVYFHQSAIMLAEEIRRNGWGVWKMWPSSYTTGNVAILGAIYAIFDYRPVLLLPLNAVLHASSGLCLILIGRKLFSGYFARTGSLVAGCLYVAFPSSLNWYAQNHKDEYAALGFLLLLLSGIRLLKAKTWKGSFISISLVLGGLALTIFVRPNNLQLFTSLGAGIIFIGAICAMKNKTKFAPLVIYALLIFISASYSYIKVSPHQESTTPKNVVSNFAQEWEWKNTPELPGVIDNTFKKIANIRVFMAANALRDGAGSMIDIGRMPSNFYEVLGYFPAAGLNGLFAPYPDTWMTKKSPFWVVGVIEIFVFYLLFPGVLWLIWKNKENLSLWWVVLTTYAVLTAEAFLASNLGTLHRIRYPFLFIFILLGCLGWCNFLTLCFPKSFLKDKTTVFEPLLSPLPADDTLRIQSFYKAIPFLLATGLLFFALFSRDILLAHVLGLNSILDDYQYAANLPLAAAALLAVPLCPALIVEFERLHSSNPSLAKQWVGAMSGKLLLWFAVIALFLLLIGQSGFLNGHLQNPSFLGIWFFPVVLFSGVTVLGSTVLICNNQAIRTTFFQLPVPILTIFLVYFFGDSQLGFIAPAAGLALGQIINLVLVAYFCHKCGYPLSPRWYSVNWSKWGPTYASLAASAAVAGLSVPVALSFTSGLTVGSTSTFYMGAKIFQSVSVFIGAIFLSLVLPYFIRLVHYRQREYAQKIFGDTLILGVYIATIFSLLICLIAPELAKFLFLGKKIGIEQLETISLVIQIGIVQLPFFVAALTIVKYLVALKETKVIFFITIVGQIINAYISWLIVSHGLYVEMLSIGVAFGLAASSLLLIFWVKVKAILGWKGFYALFLILLLFATMVSSVLLSNYLALFFSFSIYIILPLLFKILNHQRAGGLNPI